MVLQLILLLCIPQLQAIYGETLDVVLANAELPRALSHSTTVYDGKDSVYILGGMSRLGFSSDLLKYSISSDQVEIIGNGVKMQTSSGVWTKDEKLFQFGGSSSSTTKNEIWSASIDNPNVWDLVANFPITLEQTGSVWDGEESSYVIGGTGDVGTSNAIFRFNHTDHGVSIAGRLPTGRYWPTAVCDNTTQEVYIFNGFDIEGSLGEILKFEPISGAVTKLQENVPFAFMSCTVWTGTEAYIIGGFTTPFTIYRFNPSTNSLTAIPVNNGPTEGVFALGCAHVKSLNRIYIFGGARFGNGYGPKRDIMYVDLTSE